MLPAGWDRRYSTTELIWTAEPNRFLVEEAAGIQPGRALDLGAGEGRNAVWLASQGVPTDDGTRTAIDALVCVRRPT